jgi:hypothetical protein
MTDTCEKCGKEMQVGEWAFCPHGFPERPGGVAVVSDDITGGARYFENLGPERVWIETKSQLRAELKARGLRENVKHVGYNGTDKSPQTQRFV